MLSDANTGKEIRRFAEKRSEKLIFRHIALSADGKTLAGGGSDGVIYLWDVATGKEIQQLKNHQQGVAQKDGWTLSEIALAFTPDGKRLVSAANKRILIWDMQTADLQRKAEKSDKPAIKEPQQEGKNSDVSKPLPPDIVRGLEKQGGRSRLDAAIIPKCAFHRHAPQAATRIFAAMCAIPAIKSWGQGQWRRQSGALCGRH